MEPGGGYLSVKDIMHVLTVSTIGTPTGRVEPKEAIVGVREGASNMSAIVTGPPLA